MTKERKAEYISAATLQHLRNTIEEPLRREISQLRHTILELARDQKLVYEALEKRLGESEPWLWEQQAVKAIIERVMHGPLVELPLPEIAGVTMEDVRVPCPLCGAGRQPFTHQKDEANTIGTYSVPFGLQSHLEGHGRMRKCPVMAVARDLAREAWEQKQKDPTPQRGGGRNQPSG